MSAKTVKTTPVERDADLGPAGFRITGSWPLGRLQAFANAREYTEPLVDEELELTAERLRQDWLGPRTRIPGLWLTGQDTLTCGVTGAMMSGMLTTMAMVGMRRMGPLMKRIYS